MSNPIVQIKRGEANYSWINFMESLSPGELCDIKTNGIHRLFIGNGTYSPILLNPEYHTNFRIWQSRGWYPGHRRH